MADLFGFSWCYSIGRIPWTLLVRFRQEIAYLWSGSVGFAKSFTDFRKEIIVKVHHLIGRCVSRKEPLGLVIFGKAQALNIE